MDGVQRIVAGEDRPKEPSFPGAGAEALEPTRLKASYKASYRNPTQVR
jgi:hypothetical protein